MNLFWQCFAKIKPTTGKRQEVCKTCIFAQEKPSKVQYIQESREWNDLKTGAFHCCTIVDQ